MPDGREHDENCRRRAALSRIASAPTIDVARQIAADALRASHHDPRTHVLMFDFALDRWVIERYDGCAEPHEWGGLA